MLRSAGEEMDLPVLKGQSSGLQRPGRRRLRSHQGTPVQPQARAEGMPGAVTSLQPIRTTRRIQPHHPGSRGASGHAGPEGAHVGASVRLGTADPPPREPVHSRAAAAPPAGCGHGSRDRPGSGGCRAADPSGPPSPGPGPCIQARSKATAPWGGQPPRETPRSAPRATAATAAANPPPL